MDTNSLIFLLILFIGFPLVAWLGIKFNVRGMRNPNKQFPGMLGGVLIYWAISYAVSQIQGETFQLSSSAIAAGMFTIVMWFWVTLFKWIGRSLSQTAQ